MNGIVYSEAEVCNCVYKMFNKFLRLRESRINGRRVLSRVFTVTIVEIRNGWMGRKDSFPDNRILPGSHVFLRMRGTLRKFI